MAVHADFSYDVFLSHNSADRTAVRRLAERLKNAGVRVWFDEWAIRTGDDIYLAIERGLESSRALVLCMSPAAFSSSWVDLERATAIFRDPTNTRRRFIPLLLADCEVPDTLRRYKYVDYRNGSDEAFVTLLQSFEMALPDVPRRRTPSGARRSLLLKVAILALTIGGITVIGLLMSRSWFDASRSADPPGVSDAGGQAIPREPTQSAPATNASPGSATQEDKSSGRAVRNAAPAAVRGSVIDQTGNPVDEAIVSIVGFGDATKTNKVGNFVLPVPATDVVQIRAAKAGYVTRTQTHPVSNHPATIQLTRQSP